MKTLLYSNHDQLQLAEQEPPEPSTTDVVMEVAACGICGSELESFKTRSPRRPPPLVMGHEFCGTISRVGSSVTGFSPGQRVVSNSVVPCGKCSTCLAGRTHLCPHRQVFGMHRPGAFAQHVLVPADCLIPWPETLPASAACLAEPLGNGVHVLNLLKGHNLERVLVIGAGPIGLMCLIAMERGGATTRVITDLIPERLQAAERLNARTVVAGTATFDSDCLKAADGHYYDVVIDAVGGSATTEAAIRLVRPGGTVVLIGLHENNRVINSYDLVLTEKKITGSYATKMSDLQTAVDWMATGEIDVQSWVQAFPLDEGVEAFHRMLAAKGNDIKGVLIPNP